MSHVSCFMLLLYNTFSRKKQIFKPLHHKKVGIYTCGPTVYNFAHIGNLRAFITADIIIRVFKYNGYNVKWVMNTTDVDDKTIKGARKLKGYKENSKKVLKDFTKNYEKLFWQDLSKLNILKPDVISRATEHISKMQDLIRRILKRGYGYIKNGSIYFNVKKYAQDFKYGVLVDLDLEKLKQGARIDTDEYEKENIQDFVLWKAKKRNEPSWDFSLQDKNFPGRPGWHIECSAMSYQYLGNPFDIHTGGVDLKFPHHEDEIAQSQAGYGKSPVRFWLHNEHLLVEGQKMAKRLKNFYILKDIEKRELFPLAYRYLVLTSHYRSKLNFTWRSLKASQNALTSLYEYLESQPKTQNMKLKAQVKNFQKKFLEALNNDLDTPKALAVTWEVVKSDLDGLSKRKLLLKFDQVLGLGLNKIKMKKLKVPKEIQKLVERREKYRQERNWQKADQIRRRIEKLGFKIEDTPEGPKIKSKEKIKIVLKN